MITTKVIVFNALVILLMCVPPNYTKKPRAKYIKPCSKSAPDFDECCVAHGKEALPYIIKGDKEYNLPSLSPLIVEFVLLDSNGLKMSLKDLHISGFEQNDLKQVKFNFAKKSILIKILFERLELIGDYEIDGRILLFPIQGSGRANFTVVELDVDYNINYKLQDKDGEEYFAVNSSSFDFTCKRTYIDIDNLFDGNKQMGDTINKALNDNWEQFIDSIKPVVTETMMTIGRTILTGFGSTVPFKDIFFD